MQACTRCGTELSYAGRPCPLCISPALFAMACGRAQEPRSPIAGHAPMPGRRLHPPIRRRAFAAFEVFTRWTWNSLAIAALVHGILFAIALRFRDEIVMVANQVQQVAVSNAVVSPALLPDPIPVEKPEAKGSDDDMQTPLVVDDYVSPAGDPEYVAPPEAKPYAPLPDSTPPRAGPDLPFKFRLPESSQGLGGGRPETGGGLLQNRKGVSRAAALKHYGGGEDTEGAVNLGLEYLAQAQASDGSWDPDRGFNRRVSRVDFGKRGALTALCTLPFLAAGNSPAEGRYRQNVQLAVNWLIRNQTSDGCLSDRNMWQMYTHTVATLALCEAYGMTRDARIRGAAERALRFLERTQGVGGGWDYTAGVTSGNRAPERNDLSISGWGVLALKSAQAVGLRVSGPGWDRAADLYDRQSLESGETYYADRDTGSLSAHRKGIGMVGVGLTARAILDPGRFAKRNAAAERLLLENTPDYQRLYDPSNGPDAPNFTTFYGWYYGTLGLFLKNEGRGPAWEKWNAALKETLLKNQVLSGPKKGAWNADDTWMGPICGDLYSTACAVLCLEVYYRYNPSHLPETEPTLPASTVLRPKTAEPQPGKPVEIDGEVLDLDKPADRSKYLRLIVRDKGEGATALLIDYLADVSATVRTTALYELGKLKAKVAVEPVCNMLARTENHDLRPTICDTLGRIGDKAAAQPLIKLLSDSDNLVSGGARSALVRISGGKDFGVNKHAWADHFGVNA